MLFDIEPKTRREGLFDRDNEVDSILNFIRGRSRFLEIYGIRRVGKTSVLRVALNEVNIPYCYIDARTLENDFTKRRFY
ncbi:ATPase [Vulcanisaeta moutnovskia 768-28]|uniref:ATPase n=1 Tax=Vulcanisaeta moutnovskia (strain 768-28) TaxID=985053 RepID=F0QWF5_VULM7|nr:ATP-binding protein [Vulcanisaeta moutnovskia]ADY01003.1 ATPase [Vulcanisaeta moutnovskia 768-28]